VTMQGEERRASKGVGQRAPHPWSPKQTREKEKKGRCPPECAAVRHRRVVLSPNAPPKEAGEGCHSPLNHRMSCPCLAPWPSAESKLGCGAATATDSKARPGSWLEERAGEAATVKRRVAWRWPARRHTPRGEERQPDTGGVEAASTRERESRWGLRRGCLCGADSTKQAKTVQ
jgi:hypothetical protein